jgi:hypothetical protein
VNVHAAFCRIIFGCLSCMKSIVTQWQSLLQHALDVITAYGLLQVDDFQQGVCQSLAALQ